MERTSTASTETICSTFSNPFYEFPRNVSMVPTTCKKTSPKEVRKVLHRKATTDEIPWVCCKDNV
uniref:Uncharacterized protein n=1 Tax=Magallana gigas TaxID=29159 RepID=K1QPT1_MAGGI